MKCKSMVEISQAKIGYQIPVKFNGKKIGIAMINRDEIIMVVDDHEVELKRAISQPGLSGFSFEIIGDNA